MVTLYKYFIYVFIFLSNMMSNWNSFKSVKHLFLSVIVQWPTLICSPDFEYKIYTKFCWNMGYILYTNISYTFGIQNDTKICQNMEYILYTNILYTFCTHQFWSTKSVYHKHYVYNLYTKFIQNVVQIIVCRLDPLFQHILTCLLCTS